jgi:DNA-binding phage protein
MRIKTTTYRDVQQKPCQFYRHGLLHITISRQMLDAKLLCVQAHRVDVTARLQPENLNRQSMYRMFSESGNPTVSSLLTVLNALGIAISFTSQEKKRRVA